MASKNITFDTIPASVRKPGKYFEFNTKLAVRTLPANKQKMLIIGQRLATGSVAEAVPTAIFSDAAAAEGFGYGSISHQMAHAAIVANQYLDLTIVALDDAATAQKAGGTNTIGGPATAPGSVKFRVGNKAVEVGYAAADTAAEIAAAIVAECAKYQELPVTVAVNGGVASQIDVTAKHGGTLGNQIGLSCEVTPGSGVSATIVAMTGGMVDPDIATALAAVYAEQYDVIVTPYNDSTSLTALRDHLDNVSGALEQRPGVGVYGTTGALADATTLAAALNSGRMTGGLLRGTRALSWEFAASYAAIVAFEEDPAMPLNTLDLPGIHAPAIDDRLSRTEQESCLYNGVTPFEVGPGERVQVVRAITTYTEDAQGVDDISLLDLTTIRSLDYVRKSCRQRIALRYPRAKKSVRTKKGVRTELIDVLYKLEELEIVENVTEHLDKLIVEDDLQDPNRLDAAIPSDVVNGLHVFAGRIDLIL